MLARSIRIPFHTRATGLLCLLLAPFAPAAAQVVESRDGTTYFECRNFQVEGDMLAFLHAGGRSRVPVDRIVRMPDEARTRLGLAEENRVMKVVERADTTARFLEAHAGYQNALAEQRALEAAKPVRLKFTVVEQIEPRVAGLPPLEGGGELYRVRTGDGSAAAPEALLETIGEKIFVSSQQELDVRYLRKVSVQRAGLPGSIVPLFREAGGAHAEGAAALQARIDELRRTAETLGLKLHPGSPCDRCRSGACATCAGSKTRPCAACRGTRFTEARIVQAPCKACLGRGTFERINGPPAPCRTCQGTARVTTGSTQDRCPACAGQGGTPCPACQGKGLCATCAGKGLLPVKALSEEQLLWLRRDLEKRAP